MSAAADTKRCVSENDPSDATFYACPVTGRPCVVLEPLRERMVDDLGHDGAARLTADAVEHGLPCGSCFIGERDARNLPGLRLGKHERRILLSAPPGSKCGWRDSGPGRPTYPFGGEIIYPPGPSRSDEEANRRALKKLEAVGLIELGRGAAWQEDQEPPKWFKAKRARSRYWMMGRRYRSAALTPLGELVVERCRDELENGKPIRWARLIDGLAEDVRQPLGELFRQFGLWTGGVVFLLGFGASFAPSKEGKDRATKRREAAKKFQAFVLEKAAESIVARTTVGNRYSGKPKDCHGDVLAKIAHSR